MKCQLSTPDTGHWRGRNDLYMRNKTADSRQLQLIQLESWIECHYLNGFSNGCRHTTRLCPSGREFNFWVDRCN